MNIRRARIREAVEDLLRMAKVSGPPVPVEQLIRLQNIEVVSKRFEDETSGFAYSDFKSGSDTIGLNIAHSKARRRFTLAHELGHLLFHKRRDRPLYVDQSDFFVRFRGQLSSSGSDREEREANAFAAELLMPTRFLMGDVKELTNGISVSDETLLRKMANKYGVSLQALSFRLINLGLIVD